MSLLARFRKPSTDDPSEEVAEETVEDLPPIATATDQLTSTLAARTMSAALIGCLILGPIAAALAVYAVAQSTSSPVTPAAVDDDARGEQAVVQEFAVRVTVAWLTATRDHPEELLKLAPLAQGQALPERGFTVANPSTSQIQQLGPDLWSVTVAATVTDDRRSVVRRYYQLPVSFRSGTLTSLALPGPTTAPTVGAPAKSEYRTELLTDSPVGTTTSQFLSAYVGGSGDVSRYVTPGVQLTAVQPAPFTAVRVTELRTTSNADLSAPTDGQRIRVLVAAVGTVTDQQTVAVNYALTLSGRDGRWEISAIDQAPVVVDPSTSTPDPPSDPTPTPTSS